MELRRIYGEFDSEELAELAGGRIRRAVPGIQRMTIYRLTGTRKPLNGRIRLTMLPMHPNMLALVGDPAYSGYQPAFPEVEQQRAAELLILCEDRSAARVEALLHAAGAMRVRC